MSNRPPRRPHNFLTEEEQQNKPRITKALILRVLSYLKPYKWQLTAVLFVIIISSLLGLLPSLITGRIIDTALTAKDMKLLLQLVGLALITLFASQIIGVLESYINAWISQRIIYDMKNEMYRHLQTMPHSFFTNEKQGEIITRMNSDINGVASVISDTLTSIVSNIATVVTTVVALFAMNWQLAIVGLLIIPLLIMPTRQAGKARYQLLSANQSKRDELNDIINETLSVSGSLLIKLFAREEQKNEEFEKVNRQVCDLAIKEDRAGKWFRVIMGIFTQIGPLLIYLAGGWLIISQTSPALTVGVITATVSLINRLYRPVQSLLSIQVDFTRSMALFTRIFDYLDRRSDIVSPPNPQKPDLDKADIVYDHVAFNYDADHPVLKDVSFAVASGKTYALVGKSGAGKSTIASLLPRLYDVSGGAITIGGVDIRQFDLAYLRSNIGFVSQEAYLFNGTIKDNLLFVKPDATDDQLDWACRNANLDEFIKAQPAGYNTIVGNRGLKLSGGEKQRLSIARVILKDPPFLILDEATSSLDSISESLIQQALDTLMQKRTSLVIAHRLSTILAADQILVIDNGIIAEAGSHQKLLAENGLYKELYETQFRKVIDMENENHTESVNP